MVQDANNDINSCNESFEFLVHGADLMCGILNTYPSVYQTHCKKESFMHRVVRIFRVARENFGIHHGSKH